MSTAAVDYPSVSAARERLDDVLDAAARGRVVTIARGRHVSAVVAADRLRDHLFRTLSPGLRVSVDGGRAVALLEARPFVSEGTDAERALADLVGSLREYADDWELRLQRAPNHADAWGLVQLVRLSSDGQLLEWFEHGGE